MPNIGGSFSSSQADSRLVGRCCSLTVAQTTLCTQATESRDKSTSCSYNPPVLMDTNLRIVRCQRCVVKQRSARERTAGPERKLLHYAACITSLGNAKPSLGRAFFGGCSTAAKCEFEASSVEVQRQPEVLTCVQP